MSYQDYSSGSDYSTRRRYSRQSDRYGADDDLRGLCRRTLRRANEAMTPSGSKHWMIFAAGVVVGLILG
ncbi:hypothetical protein [Pelagibius sp. Alg239-R121]|uniref:hypothetical protein n=1 Tax=Pelagibius sp. Alg239-R121 TaxID=2993448 RepID=UPI0024A61A46|nr:hypothetical protein [Pelagibius sp. Alg239-R121]